MKALFRPFALHAAYTPIETIVFFCIIGTLAYFHVLSAIRHSAFLDPAQAIYAQPTLKAAYALYQSGEWVTVRDKTFVGAVKAKTDTTLEIQQLVYTLDLPRGNKNGANEYPTLSLSQPPLFASTLNLTKFISTTFTSASGRVYTASCHRPSLATLNYSAQPHSDTTGPPAEAANPSQSQSGPCFTAQQGGQHKVLQTLTFKPGMRDDFISELTGEGSSHAHHHSIGHHTVPPLPKPKIFIDVSGVKFEVDSGKNPDALPLGQMRNGKWVAYAARALVIRFWDLAKKADSLDILLILAGYILMHTTFYLLLTRSRKLGSSFWLPLAIMSSAILALLISLPIAMALKIPIDPVALTEALPFLVCTVGFDKPLRLARAVFLHPHLTVPPPPGSSSISGYPTTQSTSQTLLPPLPLSQSQAQQLKPAPRIITESLSLVYAPIIRDYILEIAVLTVGAYSKVGGLREVCALAALILGVDCLLLTTYLAAILGVMVEVRRIKTVRAMTRSRANSFSSISSSTSVATPRQRQSAMVKPPVPPAPKTLKQRVTAALLGGEKGCGLPGYESGVVSRNRLNGKGNVRKQKEKAENPVARLKLLLIASFLILHILNLITPLTPSRQASSAGAGQLNIRKVDITSPPLRSVLHALVEASRPDLGMTFDDEDGEPTTERNMLVKVHPPVHIKVVTPPSLLAAHRSPRVPSSAQAPSSSRSASLSSFLPHTFNTLTSTHKSMSEMIEAFMSSWTRLVGDPILSKWIVVMLAISFALNGYLLKGIAAGVVGARVRAGFGGVRFEQGVDHEEVEEVEVERVQVRHVEVQHVEVPQQRVVMPVEEKKRSNPPSPLKSVANVATFTLEDVDRKLKASKAAKAARRMTVTPTSAATPKPHAPSRPTPPESASESSSSETSHDADVEESDIDDADLDADLHVRTLEECIEIFENGPRPLSASLTLLNDEEVILLAQNGKVAAYALEKVLGMDQLERAVRIRRALVSRASSTQTLEYSDIPLSHYDYSRVFGACCENVVGYIPIPLGIAGPLNIDGSLCPIPMATAEGTLVASTSRGCKALNAGGGVTTVLTKDGMTRGPAIDFPSVTMAADAKCWIDSEDGYATIKEAFESTSRFAKLKSLKTAMAGRTLFVRFATATGDAMGMNMISKGTEKALEVMQKHYPEMVTLALSGNYCTDKKPAAINWIEGRGKSVVAEAVIPGNVVKTVLKTTVDALCNLNIKKNLVGSAMAGSIGGFNAHAANILTAIFLATGQDPAQNVESSMCMTLMEPVNNNEDLLMTVTMPCIEVGTVGGGTVLGPQQGVLEMLGIKGAHPTHPGHNAQALARLIAASVMAGELSLLSALAAGHLIRAHMAHNRSQTNTPATSVPVTPGPTTGPVVKGLLVSGEPEDEKDKMDKKKGKALLGPLTPSSSTSSLPPYSQ